MPRVANGLGIVHPVDAEGRDGRSRGARAECRRRSALHGLLTCALRRQGIAAMSRIGKKPVAVPAGVTATVDGQTVAVKGPKGELTFVAPDDVVVKLEDGAIKVDAARRRPSARARMWGMSRAQVAQSRRRRDQGLREEARDQRRRLSRGGAGKNLQLSLGYSHDVDLSDPGRHRRSRRRSRPKSRSPASTSSRSARSPPKSARSAAPSPTRARASNTPTNSSSARKARRSKERRHGQATSSSTSAARRASAARSARAPTAGRGCRCSARRSRSTRRSSTTRRASTLVAASSLEKALREALKTGADVEAAQGVGKLIAERADEGGRQRGRVRPRRLHVSRARQGARRRRPRGRPGVLTGNVTKRAADEASGVRASDG